MFLLKQSVVFSPDGINIVTHILLGLTDQSLPVSPVRADHASIGICQEISIQPLTAA